MTHQFIPCIPPKSTAQAGQRIMKRKDGSQFIGKFANSKSKAAQNTLLQLLQPYTPTSPYDFPLQCHIGWVSPWRKSEPKKNRVAGWRWSDKRPDCDNLSKTIQDVMSTLGYWIDDSQVCRLFVDKGWGDRPGIYISIQEIPELAMPAWYSTVLRDWKE